MQSACLQAWLHKDTVKDALTHSNSYPFIMKQCSHIHVHLTFPSDTVLPAVMVPSPLHILTSLGHCNNKRFMLK